MFLVPYLTLVLLITLQMYKAQKCEEFTDLNFSHTFIGTSISVRLLLYTRSNATCGILLSHTNLSDHAQFNLFRPTTFVIHGYRPTGSPPVWLHDITALLLAREDINVVVVDWNHGAANLNYFKAVENTHKAAENLTAFIQMMQENGANLSFIHMIGVSLGAHISGFVGATFKGQIGRITGLDPAGPQFTGRDKSERLDPEDAQFVDVLHTDIDALGFREPVGDIDFYANGGADQPGCPNTIFSGKAYFKCDHQRSVSLFLESMNGTCSSRAFPCSSYKHFLDGKCLNCKRFGDDGCPVFGYEAKKWKNYLKKPEPMKVYFKTNAQPPFCVTNYMVDVKIWNKKAHWGYLTVKLYNDTKEAVANIDQESEFKKFTETRLFAQFDKDIQSVKKVSLKYSTGNVLQPKRKLRILRLRLTHLEHQERPWCRYDILLEEDREITFKPIPCDESNF
ncbi:lipase member H isoform X2 [Cololabis saira]|uniref:lipase member H isoform X2 n=1 Tax=Cololabis saira TaxID=129043 RepID=UPI002AD3F114|nr:lipase member H isoform X2 [Cololabis saira]